MGPLTIFFTRRLLKDEGIFYISPLKINPTWRNKKAWAERIAKWLDRFLISKPIIEGSIRVRKWVISHGYSNHFPIILEMDFVGRRPPDSFKFNSPWLYEEEYVNLVKQL